MSVMKNIHEKAKKLNGRIVLPEGFEERTIKAARILTDEKLCVPILLEIRMKSRKTQMRAART